MPDILSNLSTESLRTNPRSRRMLGALFVVFIIIGVSLGYLFSAPSVVPTALPESTTTTLNRPETVEMQGVITYVDPQFYPLEGFSYTLNSAEGKQLILLKSNDQKLAVSEGHFVTVSGQKKKSEASGNEYLLVERVVINNGTN